VVLGPLPQEGQKTAGVEAARRVRPSFQVPEA
jgi:hypothetical protein